MGVILLKNVNMNININFSYGLKSYSRRPFPIISIIGSQI